MKVFSTQQFIARTSTGRRTTRIFASVFAAITMVACLDPPPEVRVAAGAVQRVQFAFAGWNDHTQIDAAGRSISVQGIAPIPLNAAVELRGSKQNAQLLCVIRAQRCWPIHQPQQHDWALLNVKP